MSTTTPPGRQLGLVSGPLGDHEPTYLVEPTPPNPGPETHIPYWAYITGRDTVHDDRVVETVVKCRECESRPAGADGLCPPCRQTQWGGQMGGRRL